MGELEEGTADGFCRCPKNLSVEIDMTASFMSFGVQAFIKIERSCCVCVGACVCTSNSLESGWMYGKLNTANLKKKDISVSAISILEEITRIGQARLVENSIILPVEGVCITGVGRNDIA